MKDAAPITEASPIPEEATLPATNLPERIYLQRDDGCVENNCFERHAEHTTWCVDKINNGDVQYLRIDLHRATLKVANDQSDKLLDRGMQMAEEIERLRESLTARDDDAAKDRARLAYVREFIDGLGGFDLHEHAYTYASAFGREQPNDDDYLAATRDAFDALMKEGA